MAEILGHSYDGNMEEAYLSLARRDMRAFRAVAAKVGFAVFQKMDAVTTLALLTEANLGVNQMRVIKRFLLQHLGSTVLQVESLLKEEMKSQALAPEDLEFGEIELVSKDGTSTIAAIGRVKSLYPVVERDLDVNGHLERSLGPSAPPGAVLSSLMDDSGGGNEKIVYAQRSLLEPCSTNTASLVVLCEGDDKAETKRTIGGDVFKEFGKLPSSEVYCVSSTGPSTDDKSAAPVTTRHKLLRPGMNFTMCVKEKRMTIRLLEKRQLRRTSDRELLGVLVLVARDDVGEDDDGELLGFLTLQFAQTFQTTPSVWDDCDEHELFDDGDGDVDDVLAQRRSILKRYGRERVKAQPREEVWPVVWQRIFSYASDDGDDGSLREGASFKVLKVADATKTVSPVQREAPATPARRQRLLELASGAVTGLANALLVRALEAREARDLRIVRENVSNEAAEALQGTDRTCSFLDGPAKRKATAVARAARATSKAAHADLEAALRAQEAAKRCSKARGARSNEPG
jgi:hypothetical protein